MTTRRLAAILAADVVGFSSDPLPISHDEQVVHALEQPRITPKREPPVDGGARR